MMSPTNSDPNRVELYTDGACKGNPGPGGWAFILRHPDSGKELEQSGAEPQSTNNRMELTAVIQGLLTLKRPSAVDLYTDSEYVGKGISQWLPKWKKDGWRRGTSPLKNVDLWQALDKQLARHQVTYYRVLGHSGHSENERCDQLAVAAYQQLLGH